MHPSPGRHTPEEPPEARLSARVLPICALLAGALLVGSACRRAPDPLVVLAASSLTESLTAVGAAWAQAGHPPLTFSFDASSKLARQIEAGAPADLFFSADGEWMDALAAKGLVATDTRVDLLGNRLVTVVRADGGWAPTGPEALGGPALLHLALAGESVPAGRYAQAALTATGAWAAVAPRVVRADNVRAALTWVATGQAEAGVVYATDARVEPRVTVAFVFPEATHPPIVYPAAALSDAPAEARAFLDWCQGPEARAIFAAAGFTEPAGAAAR